MITEAAAKKEEKENMVEEAKEEVVEKTPSTYEELSLRAKELDKQRDALFLLEKALEDDISSFVQHLIEDEKLFFGTRWALELECAEPMLYAQTEPKGEKASEALNQIRSLIDNGCRCLFIIDDDVSFTVDDLQLTLSFTTESKLISFAEKHGLKVDGFSIKEKLAELKRGIASLESFVKVF